MIIGVETEYIAICLRLICTMLVLPGREFVPTRFRIMLALVLSIVVTPLVSDALHQVYGKSVGIVVFMREGIIGFFLGIIINITFSAINILGDNISSAIGLSTAVYGGMLGEQENILVVFFRMMTLAVVVITGLHLELISNIVESYHIFSSFEIADMFDSVVKGVVLAVRVGVELAGLFIILSVIFSLVVCIAGRLVPKIQMFFLLVPLQVWLGIAVLVVVINAIVYYYIERMEDMLISILL